MPRKKPSDDERLTAHSTLVMRAIALREGWEFPRESSGSEMRAAFLAWRADPNQDRYSTVEGYAEFPMGLPEPGSTLESGERVLAARWSSDNRLGEKVKFTMVIQKPVLEE